MSVKNFVQCGLVTPIAANTTELVLVAPTASYQYPPLDGGTLVIADSVARPTFYEVISYTHRIDNVLYGVVRAKESTTARAWTGAVWVYQALTAQDYVDALALKANAANAALTGTPTAPTAAPGTNTNQIATMAALQAAIAALIESSPAALNTLNELAAALGDDPNFASTMTTALAGKEPSIAAGTAAQMWLGNKTWATVLSQVHAVLLTGLGAGTNSTILASDTLIAALAKIQNQLNNKAASSDARFTDARDWTATEVSQAEAEAGTATTARKWTAQRVAQAVRGGILTGLNLTAGTAVTAADTVLVAIGKLQKQITDAATNLAGSVRATVLTGYVSGSNVALADTDTVLTAFGKVQAQLSARPESGGNIATATKLATARTLTLGASGKTFDGSANVTWTLAEMGAAPLASPTFTGTPAVPTASGAGTNTTQVASTAFVQSVVNGYLTKSGLTGGTVTLTADEAANAIIGLAGTLTSNLIVEIPTSANRIYSVNNGTTGAFTVSIKVVGLAPTVLVAQGKRNLVYTNASGAYDAINDFDAIALTGVSTCTTAAVGTNTTQIASTAYTVAEIGSRAPTKTGVGASGSWAIGITGNAATATKLATARTINGIAFDGTANISIPTSAEDSEVAAASIAAGALNLSAFTKGTATVALTSNITSITLPAGVAGKRVDLTIQFTQDATGGRTVAGWPGGVKFESGDAPVIDPQPDGVTQVVLTNLNNTGWGVYGDGPIGALPMARLPATQRLIIGASNGTVLLTEALVANKAWYIPFTVPRVMKVASLGISVSTAAAGTGQIGIYNSDGDPDYDYPGSTLAMSAAGALNTGTTGTKLITINAVLQPGVIYWAALVNSSSATVRSMPAAGMQCPLGFSDNVANPVAGLTYAGTSNTLPPSATTKASLTVINGEVPAIYLVEE